MKVEIWTDGACLGNPGPGGHAAILKAGEREREVVGGELETTNNRMELLAAITALEALKKPSSVRLVSDSEYVIKGITQWIDGWRAKGWKKIKNRDLWERLAEATAPHEVRWEWVRGHSGDVMNERVDQLAVAEAERQKELAARGGAAAVAPEKKKEAPEKKKADEGWAVVRVDAGEDGVRVLRVVASEEAAKAEVERLDRVEAAAGRRHFAQSTRIER